MKTLFNKAIDVLKNISNIRKSIDSKALSDSEQVLNLIDESICSDLFVLLNIYPSDYFKRDINDIYKKLLNYCHETKDLFLGYYYTRKANENEFEVRLTSLKIILRCLVKYLFNSKYVSISKDLYHNYCIDIQISDYEDIIVMGFDKIPAFRYRNKDVEELIYVSERNIESEVLSLKQLYREIKKPKNIKQKERESLIQYANEWWNKYREYIDATYYDIRHLFEFYKGIKFEFIVCKSKIESSYVDTKSGLVLCEIKMPNEHGFEVDVSTDIKEILFYDFPEHYWFITTLGYVAGNDKLEWLDDSIKSLVEKEIINIVTSSDHNKYFDILVDIILGFYGYNKYAFDECYFKRDLSSDNAEFVELKKLNMESNINIDEIKKMVDSSKRSKLIFAYDGIFLSDVREQLKCDKAILLDYKDIMAKFGYLLVESLLSQAVVNEFIMPNVNLLTVDNSKQQTQKIASMLENDLLSCLPGVASWKEYESICYKTIRYLFEDNFSPFIAEYQIANDIGTDIRDLIIQNSGSHRFWQDVKVHYNCNNIIVECKNHRESIENVDFRQISDYLGKAVHGQFGIIFARKDLSKKGRTKQVEYLRDYNKKMILVVDDRRLLDMIHIKARGGSPEDVLAYLKFSIETSI
ncbi:MAG: hypothetical protein FWC92_10495 [Defluviitaleaceae bacterium]|nr:hypothetical protein [Defluviitaleaceae bacterium]